MVGVVLTVTTVVVIVNAGETVAPPATVTDAGTVALGSLLDSVTTAPPAGAGALRVTVLSVVDPPPTTDAGDKVTRETAGGDTVSASVTLAVALLESVTVNCGL